MIMSHMAFINCTVNAALVHISNCHSDNEDITIRDSEFNSNVNGSAITIESGCHVKIEHGLFSNHSSNVSAIQVLNGAGATVKNSLFNGSNVGSTIAVENASLKVQQCIFTENNGVNRGAIFSNVGDVL